MTTTLRLCALLGAALLPFAAAAAPATPPPLVPLRDFFRNPEKTTFSLSPDGTYLAWLQPWENRLNIHVQKIGSPEVVRVTAATARDIRRYFWKGDRLVYLLDQGGDENFRFYSVGRDGSAPKELTPFEGVRADLVDDLRDHDTDAIIQLNRRDPKVFDAYRLNAATGELTLLAENPGNITGWVTDWDGRIRAATTTDGVNNGLLYRASESEPFRIVITTDFRESLQPLYFTFDNQSLYCTSNLGRDKQAIVRIAPDTAKELEVLFEHPAVDVSDLILSRHRKLVTGVSFETDRSHYHFFDEQRARLQSDLEKRLPGYDVVVTSTSRDETKCLVRTYSDKSLGAYYYYDLAGGRFEKLVAVSPWLDETQMADMQPVRFKARDGLDLNGYLTLPKGVPAKNLPLILNPHGGPWARDTWGFDPEVQFLANRGYAVLQVNFRSSTGFGRKFWEAGFKQWGRGAMQHDLTDAVQWAIAQGIADPKRVAIYGGSYGGYAVLAGLAFTPELYAAGVDYVGPSNLFTLLASIPPYWEPIRQQMYAMVGDPEKDKDLLTAASPLFSAEQIRAPLLVIQGANDPRVKKAEADQIVAALKARGVDVPYLVKDNEGHGFRNEENRFEAYGAMEQFFAKHLGGRAEAPAKN
ncbi:MAG TPA: S9 family peptidase [Opitutaceae bacterium]|nr:S9 family peptidase [Opitutaceae bacterium]